MPVEMRRTWDALAAADSGVYVGDPTRGEAELESLFGRLDADPRGGVCVEVGCGPGRMTGALARRFDEVVALDVSPAMLEHARANVNAPNVTFTAIPGTALEVLDEDVADVLVCYLVLQHLPRRRVVLRYLKEFARVLKPEGEAFVQLPVIDRPAGRAWRGLRTLVVPVLDLVSRNPECRSEFRGVRLTEAELERGLRRAGLVVVAHDQGGDSPYRFSHDEFLRLRRK